MMSRTAIDCCSKLFFVDLVRGETRGMLLGLVLLGVVLVGGGVPLTVHAQWESARLQPLSPAAQARGGIQLLRDGQPEEARTFLHDAFLARPSLVLPKWGAVAYWMGEAYAQTGDSAQARATWRRGTRLLQEDRQFDARLADAYLRSLNRQRLRNQRLQAVDAYMGLMGRVGRDTTADLEELFRRRVAQIAPLMTDDVFGQVIDGERKKEPVTWTFRAGAGDSLQAWWRGLDPYPDTPENERLEEHLTRLVHARQSFACRGNVSGFDPRGSVYLRLGAPYKRRDLSYKDGDFFREVFRFGVPIPPSSFPESEIWLYPQLSDFGYFLFAEGEGTDCYREAKVNDLMPSTLTMMRGNTERGLNIAYSSLMAMRAIYRELALYHISFSGRYSEVADYATYQEMKATEAEMEKRMGGSLGGGGGEQQVTVGAGVGMTRTVTTNPVIGMGPPNQFVTRMVTRARREDSYAQRRREKEVPRQYTALHDNVPELPVSVRTARFLNEDGTTRTEVYWGVLADAARLIPDEEDEAPAPSMIRFSAIQHNKDRTQVQRLNRRHELPGRPESVRQVLIPDPVTFKGISSLHHLSLQWTQHRLWQQENGAIAGLGPKRRFTTARADSLSPLRATGPTPEMSDLKVLSLPDTTAEMLTQPEKYAYPYPFESITSGTPLLLSFEVYHLAFGDDDRTRYTISYEVEGETRRGWSRLFRGQDTQRTTTETTMQGAERRTKERILLDLSRIEREESQDVRVTVRVTDEVSGASVTRSLGFVLRPSGAR